MERKNLLYGFDPIYCLKLALNCKNSWDFKLTYQAPSPPMIPKHSRLSGIAIFQIPFWNEGLLQSTICLQLKIIVRWICSNFIIWNWKFLQDNSTLMCAVVPTQSIWSHLNKIEWLYFLWLELTSKEIYAKRQGKGPILKIFKFPDILLHYIITVLSNLLLPSKNLSSAHRLCSPLSNELDTNDCRQK